MKNKPTHPINERLIAFRVAHNLSQSVIADALGCNQSKVSRLEDGQGWNGSNTLMVEMILDGRLLVKESK